jgi:hypothetical protein
MMRSQQQRWAAKPQKLFWGLTILMGFGFAYTKAWGFHPDPARFTPIVVIPTAERTGPPASLPVVGIEADATQSAPGEPTLLRSTLDAISAAAGAITGAAGAAQTAETTPVEANRDWYVWGRLASPRAAATSVSDGIGPYAVHSPEGATVCLINRSGQKTATRLTLRLPRGVYKIERLIFTSSAGPTGADPSGRVTPAGAPSDFQPLLPSAQWKLLEGSDLSETGSVSKLYTLEAGQVCLYRYTDTARAARVAYREVQDRLHEMAASTPGPARRLRHLLEEGEPYLGGLSAGDRRQNGLQKRLGCIHRLLLVTAQVHSLHHNYQERKTVNAAPGKAVMAALDHLTEALGETSATLLGLVPEVTVTASGGSGPVSGGPAAGLQNADNQARRTVTIALSNTGSRSVAMVKIGLDVSALPVGILSEPEDPAFFGTLSPGQTVRATFRLRGPAAEEVPNSRCVGEVSYFAATAPAHLRLHPW